MNLVKIKVPKHSVNTQLEEFTIITPTEIQKKDWDGETVKEVSVCSLLTIPQQNEHGCDVGDSTTRTD